jgi:hypothetical protein
MKLSDTEILNWLENELESSGHIGNIRELVTTKIEKRTEEGYRNRNLPPTSFGFLKKMVVGFETINYSDKFPLRRYFLLGGGVAEEYVQHEVKRLDPDLPSFRRLGLEITGMRFEWP